MIGEISLCNLHKLQRMGIRVLEVPFRSGTHHSEGKSSRARLPIPYKSMRETEGLGTGSFLPRRPLQVSSKCQAGIARSGIDVDAAVTGDRYGALEMLNRKEHKTGRSDTQIPGAINLLHLTIFRELLSSRQVAISQPHPLLVTTSSFPHLDQTKWTDTWNRLTSQNHSRLNAAR